MKCQIIYQSLNVLRKNSQLENFYDLFEIFAHFKSETAIV